MDRINWVTRECFHAIAQLDRVDFQSSEQSADAGRARQIVSSPDAALSAQIASAADAAKAAPGRSEAAPKPSESRTPEQLHARMCRYVDLLGKKAREAGYSESEAKLIAYALVALADELVMAKSGALREFWSTRPLQLVYFGENLAGENFFVRLEQLRQAAKTPEPTRGWSTVGRVLREDTFSSGEQNRARVLRLSHAFRRQLTERLPDEAQAANPKRTRPAHVQAREASDAELVHRLPELLSARQSQRQPKNAALDVMRVYYLCLLFGFRGRYGVRGGQEPLTELIEELRTLLSRALPMPELLAPDGPRPQEPLAEVARRLPFVWMSLGVLALAAVFYLGLAVSLREQLLRFESWMIQTAGV